MMLVLLNLHGKGASTCQICQIPRMMEIETSLCLRRRIKVT